MWESLLNFYHFCCYGGSKMNYADVKDIDSANGVGVRVSLFVSGCTHHCKNCFNQETWDFGYGKKYTKEVQDHIIEACGKPFIKGLSLLGGEPFEKANQKDVCELILRFKKTYPDKDIWCYSGYLFDKDMVEGSKIWTEYTKTMLENIDFLVDGEFVDELKNLRLKFRGSANQRIIDVQKSLKTGKTEVIPDEQVDKICGGW